MVASGTVYAVYFVPHVQRRCAKQGSHLKELASCNHNQHPQPVELHRHAILNGYCSSGIMMCIHLLQHTLALANDEPCVSPCLRLKVAMPAELVFNLIPQRPWRIDSWRHGLPVGLWNIFCPAFRFPACSGSQGPGQVCAAPVWSLAQTDSCPGQEAVCLSCGAAHHLQRAQV